MRRRWMRAGGWRFSDGLVLSGNAWKRASAETRAKGREALAAALRAVGMTVAQKFEPVPGWLKAEGKRAQEAFAKRVREEPLDVKVVADPSMPPGTMEMRSGEQRVLIENVGAGSAAPQEGVTGMFDYPPGFCGKVDQWRSSACTPERPGCGSEDDPTMRKESLREPLADKLDAAAIKNAAANLAEIARVAAGGHMGRYVGEDDRGAVYEGGRAQDSAAWAAVAALASALAGGAEG
jgi:hypothetical protein